MARCPWPVSVSLRVLKLSRQFYYRWLKHKVTAIELVEAYRANALIDAHHALNYHHLIGSMGQVGAAGDNAAMESFFALLQKNVLDQRRWRTPQRTPDGNHHLDRTHLPPPTTTSPPRQIDPYRMRDHHEPGRHPGGLNPTCHPSVRQSPALGIMSRGCIDWLGPGPSTGPGPQGPGPVT